MSNPSASAAPRRRAKQQTPSPAAARGPQHSDQKFRLGLCHQEYVRSAEAEAAVRQLLAARSAVETAWAELLRSDKVWDGLTFIRKLREIFREAAEAAPTIFPQDDTGYLVTFVGRKTLLALLASERASVDWASLSRPGLEELCCDQSGFLATFDETWSAADISNFTFGRPDWGMFVSLYACLWKDAVKTKKMSHKALLQNIASGKFARAAAALRRSSRHTVHPALVVRELLAGS